MTELMRNTMDALRRRGFLVHHAATKEEAADLVRALVGDKQHIGVGGSVTIDQLGVIDAFMKEGRSPHWHWLDVEPQADIFPNAFKADVYLTSSNAITRDGVLVNIDRTGNRVAAMIWGPQHVIVVAGENKLVDGGVPQAMARIKTVACPANAKRLHLDTPCARTGKCDAMNCAAPLCCATTILEHPTAAHPITVVLVDETLGY